MKRFVPIRRETIRRLAETPEFRLLKPGVLWSLCWEVGQSPLYTDTFVAPWTTIARNRLHCVGGDGLILLVAFWLVALHWGRGWLDTVRWRPLATFLVLGMAYTTVSEYVNVVVVQSWAYSQWMPTIGRIGLMPLLQWVIVPTLSILWARRHPPRSTPTTRGDGIGSVTL